MVEPADVRTDETWHRLRGWTRGQTDSERLAGLVLRSIGYSNFRPSHPMGGRDGKRDGLADRDRKTWVVACFFPRGQVPFGSTVRKFRADYVGVAANDADGFVFVTNQELENAEKTRLEAVAGETPTDVVDLERLTHELDLPTNHGTRWQFLKVPIPGPTAGHNPSASDQSSLDALWEILSPQVIANTAYFDYESAWRATIADPWAKAVHDFGGTAGAQWVLDSPAVEAARLRLLDASAEFVRHESAGVQHPQSSFRWLGTNDDEASRDPNKLRMLRTRAARIYDAAASAAAAHETLIHTAKAHGFDLRALRTGS